MSNSASRCIFGGGYRKLCDMSICQYCFDRSFAANPKSRYLVGTTDPRCIMRGSDKYLWFACPCGHRFRARACSITKGTWCPYCCDPVQKLCDDDDCEMCLANSFASSEFAIYFDEAANHKTARQTNLNTPKKYWFNCDCGHKFMISPSSISVGEWCSYCSKQTRKLCDDDNCEMCLDNSFASSKFAPYFDEEKNKISARKAIKYSVKRYWFRCKTCNSSFHGRLSNIACWKDCICKSCKKTAT